MVWTRTTRSCQTLLRSSTICGHEYNWTAPSGCSLGERRYIVCTNDLCGEEHKLRGLLSWAIWYGELFFIIRIFKYYQKTCRLVGQAQRDEGKYYFAPTYGEDWNCVSEALGYASKGLSTKLASGPDNGTI